MRDPACASGIGISLLIAEVSEHRYLAHSGGRHGDIRLIMWEQSWCVGAAKRQVTDQNARRSDARGLACIS